MFAEGELARLLNLYSVSKLKGSFDGDAVRKGELIEDVVDRSSLSQIIDFSHHNHSTTKHHVYVYEHGGVDVAGLPGDPLGIANLVKSGEGLDGRYWFYLLSLEFDVFFRNPMGKESITFPWPVKISCSQDRVLLKVTKMEKNLRSYFPGKEVLTARGSISALQIQALMLDNMDLSDVMTLDLNQGVKSLWGEGSIDAPAVQFKKAMSVNKQVMDLEYLIKRDDPNLYEELADKPLFKGVFVWSSDADAGVDSFNVDSTRGVIEFSKYSDLSKGADYVVRTILEKNR